MPIALAPNHIPSWPAIAVQINKRAPNDPAGVDDWLDATSYVEKMSIQRGKSDELTTMGPGTLTLQLIGTSGEWDPDNAASPFYPYLTAWRQVRVLVTWAGITYPLFTGYNTDGWTTAFASRGRREYGKAQFSDALAVLERIGLLDVTLAEMLADGPLALYPLDESGGLLAGNRSAFKQDNAGISPGVLDSTSSSTAVFAQPGTLPSASGLTGLQITTVSDTTSASTYGATLALPTSAAPAGSAGFSADFWFTSQAIDNHQNPARLLVIGDTTALGYIQNEGVYIYAAGGSGTHAVSATFFHAGIAYLIIGTTQAIDDALPHHVAVTLDAARTTGSLYFDGVLVGTVTLGGAMTQTALTNVHLGHTHVFNTLAGTYTQTTTFNAFATYTAPLSAARVAAHYKAGIDAFYGDTPAVRIARLLSYPKWLTSLQNLDTTSVGELNTPLLGATGLDGVTVAAELLHIADSTLSDVDVDGSGRVRYRSRDYRLLQTTPSVIFGPNTGAGEIPYSEPAPEIGKNPKFTYPQVQVQQRNGLTALGSDATAVLNNFEQMLTKSDVILADPSMVLDFRDDLLRRYKNAHNRATPVTLNPAANPTIWPAVLGLDTAQRCRVNVTPQTAPAKSVEGYVEAFTHEVDPTSSTPWTVTVTTSAAPPFFPWILGDPVYGVLGSTTIPVF